MIIAVVVCNYCVIIMGVVCVYYVSNGCLVCDWCAMFVLCFVCIVCVISV